MEGKPTKENPESEFSQKTREPGAEKSQGN